MAAVKVSKEPFSGLQRLLGATQLLGLDQLQAVLACTFTFDSAYFQQLLDALAALHPDGPDYLRSIPIDVVCDHRHYRGHGGTYNVHCWPGTNLFHPKLLALLFADRVVWLEGSQNMTRAGYVTNRELASFHETTKGRLPYGVNRLIARLADHRIEAARAIVGATTRARTDAANRSITSLDAPLLSGLLSRVSQASDVYLAAPFFDRREQAGPSIDSTALKRLADQYPHAKFWVYLPQVTTANGHHALQASQKTFARVFGPQAPMRRLVLCGVPSDRQPLHAKLLAVRHGHRDATVTLLTGSPNLTEVALLKKGSQANVELAREVTMRWAHFERLLKPLGGRFKKIADCRFEPPSIDPPMGWHAVESATYDPLRDTLEVQWRRPELAAATRIQYAGKPLQIPANGRCRGFVINAGEFRLETISQEDPRRRSWCPIVIPLESRLALGALPDQQELPPEWWLAQLGSLPPASESWKEKATTIGSRANQPTDRFQLAVRVRDLASRMRYVADVITDTDLSQEIRVTAHLGLLRKIFDTHDPVDVVDPQEQTWRMWVRLELTQVLEQAVRKTRDASVRRVAREFRSRVSNMEVPPDFAEPWRALAESLS